MIVPDVNLLLYAHDEAAPLHPAARRWWEDLVNGTERVGIPWVVAIGFVRLATHASVLAHPLATARAVDYVEAWFRRPNITPLNPGRQHLTLVRRALEAAGVVGNLVTDACGRADQAGLRCAFSSSEPAASSAATCPAGS